MPKKFNPFLIGNLDETGSSGGSVATDTIWDAKGDLAVGTGANTASRLAVGTNGQVLTADSAEATGTKWSTVAGTGDVVGPASATDNAIARFDTTTGKLLQDSVVTIADTTGNIAGPQEYKLRGTTSGTTAIVATAIAGTTTVTLPSATDTLVGKATTDTLTNKTLTSPVINTGLELGHATDTTLTRVSAGVVAIEGVNIETTTTTANSKIHSIGITIDGGGSAITTGVKGYIEVPYACTINRATTLADQSGSIVIDVWKDTYANYPPTVADTITASAKPTISSATKAQDSTLTGWTTSIAAGDILGFKVDSASTVTRVHLILKVTKT